VVILDPNDRAPRAAPRLVGHGVSEAKVDRAVALPERRPELEVLDEHVTERPQRAIREAVVVALDVVVIQPDAPERVRLLVGWHADAADVIRRVTVRRPGAPRHPRPVDSPHRRVERRNEAPRRLPHLHAVHAAHVLVGLAVGDEDELAVAEVSVDIEHEAVAARAG
jgi:hypothetical protein